MAEKSSRRKYTTEQKAEILARHLKGKEAISDICDELGLQPSQFYRWQEQLFQNMALALEPGKRKQKASAHDSALAKENEALRAKLIKKDNVIAEISEEHVALKKELGEL